MGTLNKNKKWDLFVNKVDHGRVMGDGCCSVVCVIRCGEHIIKCVKKGEIIDEIYFDFRKALLSSPHSILIYKQSAWTRKYKLLK